MRFIVPAAVLAALAVAAPVASADPVNSPGVRTFERVCDDGNTYTTYKVGHGAAFIAGTDEKFVNLQGTAADQHDVLTCTFTQVAGPVKGSTGGTLTSVIVP